MNKKQLIVAWVMGILISAFFLAFASYGRASDLRTSIMYSIPILIIGGLLIYITGYFDISICANHIWDIAVGYENWNIKRCTYCSPIDLFWWS